MEFVTQNILWIAIALVSGGMFLAPLFRGNGRFGVGTADAIMLINREDAIVVDVRNAAEFEKGHLPNARSIPADELPARAGELNRFKKKPVILVCEKGTPSSAKAVDVLRKLDFERAVNLAGGTAAWVQAGQPLVKGRASGAQQGAGRK